MIDATVPPTLEVLAFSASLHAGPLNTTPANHAARIAKQPGEPPGAGVDRVDDVVEVAP